MFQIVEKIFFVIKNVKNTVPWTYVISNLNDEELVETFYEKELQKQIKKSLKLKKLSKNKVINYMLNGKAMIILLLLGLIKKVYYK